jgi:predicted polyphosphate/ATP-dependent NAD kinase
VCRNVKAQILVQHHQDNNRLHHDEVVVVGEEQVRLLLLKKRKKKYLILPTKYPTISNDVTSMVTEQQMQMIEIWMEMVFQMEKILILMEMDYKIL